MTKFRLFGSAPVPSSDAPNQPSDAPPSDRLSPGTPTPEDGPEDVAQPESPPGKASPETPRETPQETEWSETTHSPTPQAADLADTLKKLLSVVTTAQRLMKDRQAVDLSSLDRRVADLCENIAALPRNEAGIFVKPLETLIKALDTLEQTAQDSMVARAWLWSDAEGITPMRRMTDTPPAGVVTSTYATIHQSGQPGSTDKKPDVQDRRAPRSSPPPSDETV